MKKLNAVRCSRCGKVHSVEKGCSTISKYSWMTCAMCMWKFEGVPFGYKKKDSGIYCTIGYKPTKIKDIYENRYDECDFFSILDIDMLSEDELETYKSMKKKIDDDRYIREIREDADNKINNYLNGE